MQLYKRSPEFSTCRLQLKRAGLAFALFAVFTGTALADVQGRVVRVLDGDTIELLQDNDTQVRIRLAGIDAPEKGQPWGQRSRQHLTRLVAQQRVDVKGTRTDRYGRLLGTVVRPPYAAVLAADAVCRKR